MLKGRYITLLTIFSLVSLVGTGFSSWLIQGSAISAEAELDVNVGQVDPIITFSRYTCFSYCDEGFVEEDSTKSADDPNKFYITSTGTLTYYFNLKAKKAIQHGITKIETYLSLSCSTHFNNSYSKNKILDSVIMTINDSQIIEANAIEDVNKDADASTNESIKCSFNITDIPSVVSTNMSIAFNFNYNFINLENGFSSSVIPTFDLEVNVL